MAYRVGRTKKSMNSKWSVFIAFVVVLSTLLFGPLNAMGQGSTAAMNGNVLDPSGLVVPDAKVTLKNIDTGVEQDAVTNAEGRYVYVALKPGHYSLQVTKQGFETSSTPEFLLSVDQTLTQDVKLVVGAATARDKMAEGAAVLQATPSVRSHFLRSTDKRTEATCFFWTASQTMDSLGTTQFRQSLTISRNLKCNPIMTVPHSGDPLEELSMLQQEAARRNTMAMYGSS